jgi:hypothetical protein
MERHAYQRLGAPLLARAIFFAEALMGAGGFRTCDLPRVSRESLD